MSDGTDVKKLPTAAQRAWLKRGIDQAGGKLPLFDDSGKQIDPRTIRACIEQGWAESWFDNPLKPDWLVCKLTPAGREIAGRAPRPLAQKPKSHAHSNVTPIRKLSPSSPAR